MIGEVGKTIILGFEEIVACALINDCLCRTKTTNNLETKAEAMALTLLLLTSTLHIN
jgi:hypothetical protein